MRSWAEVEVGQQLPSRRIEISRADLVRYAGASGDFTPIQCSDRIAREVGLPGVIAHGMFTMGQAISVVVDWLGDPAAVLEYSSKFPQAVPVDDALGAQIQVQATVATKDELTRQARIDLVVTLVGEDSTAKPIAVLGRARALVRLR